MGAQACLACPGAALRRNLGLRPRKLRGSAGGVRCPAPVRRKIVYTGYLRRSVPILSGTPPVPVGGQPYVLVTVGGGDDGMSVVDWVLAAYEHDPKIPLAAVIVLGPFMPAAMQRQFRERA